MAKIQARNVDDGLYELILQSSMKNERTLEGEIRFALQDYYRPVTPENDVPVLSGVNAGSAKPAHACCSCWTG